MIDYPRSEFETTKRDAASSIGKSVAERTAMFRQLMECVEALQSHLSPAERERRAHIGELLDPLPNPWWKNFRKEALAEYECQVSSTSSAN
jgi:hypothetical protein